jgi:serine/threonine protein kinase
MKPTVLPHPEPEQLAAFRSGQIAEETATAISQHLADCASCRTVIDSLPDDTLLALLRKSADVGQSTLESAPEDRQSAAEAATLAPSASAPSDLGIPAELVGHARYHVLRLLGSGGMGAVYKAEHRLMERHVALKVINASVMNKPAMVERFQREVKAAARLTHPNIVTAHDADQAGHIHFLVMEFVDGISLAQRVQQQGRLSVAEACSVIRQAALGLQHAFEQGMVHRDIKPHNLMLTPGGQVKILDFGLARLVREAAGPGTEASPDQPATGDGRRAGGGLTEVGVLMGTADFIAPEQANDPRRADIRADIYSLGCTFYYLLTGNPPFPEGNALDKLVAHAERMPAPLKELRPEVTAELARAIDKMMAKDPGQRYQTPAEVANALTPFLSKPSGWRHVRRAAVAAGLVAAAILAVVIYIRTDQGEFEIQTEDENVAVMINKSGGVIVRDEAGRHRYQLKAGSHQIRTGQYAIDVTELPNGVEFSTPTFKLQRGGKVTVTATFRPKEAPTSDLDRAMRVFEKALDASKELGRALKTFGPEDKPISQDQVTADDGGWCVEAKENRTVALFEIANPGVEDCMLSYRARLKTANLQGRAYLEMWCGLRGQGAFFSRGSFRPVSGTTSWASYEIPFFLKKGQRPDLIMLNLVIEGKGTVWIKDVEVTRAPLPPDFEKTAAAQPREDPGYLRDEGLRWFPANATLFGGRDMRVFHKLSVQQIIILTQFAEKFSPPDRDRVWKLVSTVGEIDRVTFAYAFDRQQPAKSRIYIRATGKINHQRVAEWFHQEWPGAVVRERKGSRGERITVAETSPGAPPAFAVIDDTDLVLAGYQGNAEKHLEVIDQVLELRAGHGESLPAGQARTLQEVPANAWAFFGGEPPAPLKNLILFPVLPRWGLLSISGTQSILVRFQGTFASAADAQAFADNLSRLKQKGIDFVKGPPFNEHPRASEVLTETLSGLKVQVTDERVSVSYQVATEALDILSDVIPKLPLSMFNKLLGLLAAPEGKEPVKKDPSPVKK